MPRLAPHRDRSWRCGTHAFCPWRMDTNRRHLTGRCNRQRPVPQLQPREARATRRTATRQYAHDVHRTHELLRAANRLTAGIAGCK